MVSSVSVTLAMALTTTTGRWGNRSLTIAATRSMARASSTEVPPNFITIIGVTSSKKRWRKEGAGARRGRNSSEVALSSQQFRVQYRCPGRSADGVVGKHGKLPVQHFTGPQAAYSRGHTRPEVHVKARLRTVIRFQIHHGELGRARQLQLLRFAAVAVPGGNNLFRAGLRFQLHRDRFGVPILHRHPVALRAHGEARGIYLRSVQVAQQL